MAFLQSTDHNLHFASVICSLYLHVGMIKHYLALLFLITSRKPQMNSPWQEWTPWDMPRKNLSYSGSVGLIHVISNREWLKVKKCCLSFIEKIEVRLSLLLKGIQNKVIFTLDEIYVMVADQVAQTAQKSAFIHVFLNTKD